MAEKKKKNPRLDDDDIGKLKQPDADTVQCHNCVWREKDRLDGAIKGAILNNCQVYDNKPYGIMWKDETCPYYTNECKEED